MPPEQVQFDESAEAHVLYSRFEPSARLPKIVQLLLKTGIVKTKEQANLLLLGLTVAFFVLAVYIFGNTFGWFDSTPPTYREGISPEVRATLPPEILNSFPSRSQ